MFYQERIGASKLNVLTDGVRFFQTIFEMALVWRPTRLFFSGAIAFLGLMTLLAVHPLEMWLTLGRLQEDMIYRLLFCWLAGALGLTFLSAGVVSDHLHRLIDDRPRRVTFAGSLLGAVYTGRGCAVLALASVPLLVWLVGRGVWTWTNDGYVEEHWSRVVLAGLIVFGLGQLTVSVLVVNLLRFHAARKALRGSVDQAVAIHTAQMAAQAATPAPTPATRSPARTPQPASTG
jgi:hypothetical protein